MSRAADTLRERRAEFIGEWLSGWAAGMYQHHKAYLAAGRLLEQRLEDAALLDAAPDREALASDWDEAARYYEDDPALLADGSTAEPDAALRERIEALCDDLADLEEGAHAAGGDSYYEGQRDAYDIAEQRARAALAGGGSE